MSERGGASTEGGSSSGGAFPMAEDQHVEDSNLGDWQRMGMGSSVGAAASAAAAAAAAAYGSLPPAPELRGLLQNRRFVYAVGVTILVLFAATALRRGSTGSGDTALRQGGTVAGADLGRSIATTVAGAEAAGLLRPIGTTVEIAEDQGIPFILSVVDASNVASKASKTTLGPDPPASADYDPFGRFHRDPRMVVAPVPRDHVLVLNKFPTMSGHVLLVTDAFQSQAAALTLSDFTAWFSLVEALPAVGFFNSALEAGASQKHKHMQLIPMDTLARASSSGGGGSGGAIADGGSGGLRWDAVPVSAAVAARVGDSRDVWRIWHLPQFDFEHALTLLPTRQEWAHAHGTGGDETDDGFERFLLDRYHALLEAVGFDRGAVQQAAAAAEAIAGAAAAAAAQGSSEENVNLRPPVVLPPYNVLLTPRFMLVVPRTRREYSGLDINGMGFLGSLLAPDGRARDAAVAAGGLALLKGVTLPRRAAATGS